MKKQANLLDYFRHAKVGREQVIMTGNTTRGGGKYKDPIKPEKVVFVGKITKPPPGVKKGSFRVNITILDETRCRFGRDGATYKIVGKKLMITKNADKAKYTIYEGKGGTYIKQSLRPSGWVGEAS